MKETLGKILRIFTTVLMVLSICMMIFTVISVLTFNRSDRQMFGYRAFIVLSDSMSATDFKAGDLVLTRDVDPAHAPARRHHRLHQHQRRELRPDRHP